ncbi:carbohydrate ABC transporter permease [Paenibacillus sp. BC26]|uniref:carbohydrate ABC transporter permease n=1 Tax=Paenibacillus sp. BC26 TaxID=1881032 RepID=UPI0008EAADE9|nr:carbohydrate ABC transporter permease [Paenibacillus sp. BC26]SFS74005.1 multiple sugar transport system permease protein [Paenibacillus sp. BC26]
MKTNGITLRFRKTRDRWQANGWLKVLSQFAVKLIHYVVVFGICFIILQPVIQKISNAFMAKEDILDITVIYLPKHISTFFITSSYLKLEYWTTFFNTFALAGIVALLQVVASSLVAYGFARFKFPGRSLLFGVLIFTMVVPPMVILIPQYITFQNFDVFGIIGMFKPGGINLLNSFWPFILTSMTVMGYKNGLYVYILRQHYRGLPKELEEAAYMDGCTRFGTYLRIILPSSYAMMMTCFLYSFVWQWTDGYYVSFYTPGFVTFSKELTTVVFEVTRVIMNELGLSDQVLPPLGYSVAIGNTASLLVILPLLVLFIFAQRFFVESIEHSGIK